MEPEFIISNRRKNLCSAAKNPTTDSFQDRFCLHDLFLQKCELVATRCFFLDISSFVRQGNASCQMENTQVRSFVQASECLGPLDGNRLIGMLHTERGVHWIQEATRPGLRGKLDLIPICILISALAETTRNVHILQPEWKGRHPDKCRGYSLMS